MAGTELQTNADGGEGSGEGGSPQDGRPWLRFALIFGFLAIASEIFYQAVTLDSAGFQIYLRTLARISAVVIGWFETKVTVRNSLISGSSFAVEVARGCDAVQVCSLLAAAVIAFPLAFWRKLRGLVLGIVVLQIVNLLRIITLFLIGAHFSSVFHAAHVYVWPSILIVVTIALWIGWVRWETRALAAVDRAT